MKKKQNYIELRRSAAHFANFGGRPEEENPFLQKANYGGGYGYMAGSGVQPIKGAKAQLFVRIQNTDPANDLVLDLFNANLGQADPFDGVADSAGTAAGAGVGLILEIGKERHIVVKNRTIHKPFLIEGLRAQFASDEQLSEEWSILSYDNNMSQQLNYYPQGAVTAGQQQSRQVDDASFSLLVSGDSGIRVKVLRAPSATQPNLMTLLFNLRAISSQEELLRGQSPIGINAGQSLGGADLY